MIEDDQRFRFALGVVLTDQGWAVGEAPTGGAALRMIDQFAADVVLLDLMLPDMSGLEVCRALRQRGDVPIIILSGRTDSSDVVAGLEAGADAYVKKPVVPTELVARIRALLRRRGARTGGTVLHLGELEIRPDQEMALRAGQPLHLTRTELRLLVELAAAGGRVVPREDLMRRVWGYDYFRDTRLLDVHIRRLRRKVERDPENPEYVITVWGRGYRAGVL